MDLKSVLIIAFSSVSVLMVSVESKKEEAKFFKLLRKLDSINMYKRKQVYEKLADFLYKNPYERYINVLKRRSKKVRLEQKLLLLNLAEKFSKITPYLKRIYSNNFMQQCPKLRLYGIDFLTDTKSYYHYWVQDKKFVYGECNRCEIREYLKELFFYTELFKEKEPSVFNIQPKNISERFDELLKINKNRRRKSLSLTLAGINYGMANIYVYAKSKNALKKISSVLLPYLCFKKHGSYIFYRYQYDDEQFNILRDNTCNSFLTLFGKYISKKSKDDLKERFKNVISRIKLRTSRYHLKQLLVFERNIDVINKFKLFPQALRYKNILREVISDKLNRLKSVCNRMSGLHNIEECGYTVKYIKSIYPYNEIIKSINSGCLCLYVNYSRINLSQLLLDNLPPRKFRWGALPRAGLTGTGESITVCEKDRLNSLMCDNPLYALKITTQCKSIKLRRFVMRIMSNFDLYSKICLQTDRDRMRYYYSSTKDYVKAIEIMGKLKRNIPKILKYTYSYIINRLYMSREVLQDLFIIINKLGDRQKYAMIKKLIRKITESITSQYTGNDYEKLRAIQDIIFECARSVFAKHCDRVLEDRTMKKLLRGILYRSVIAYIPLKLQKYFYDIMKKSSGNYLFGILKVAEYIRTISMREEILYRAYRQNTKFSSDYLEKATNVLPGSKRRKTQLAVYLLLFITDNKNIHKRIMKTYSLYFKGDDRISYKNIMTGIIERIYYNLSFPGEDVSRMLLKKGIFTEEVLNELKGAIKYICNGYIYNIPDFVTLFGGIFDGDRYEELTSLHTEIKYKIVMLFPMILSSVKNYLQLNKNIYFTTVNNLLSNEYVKNKFCRDMACSDLYRMEFMPKTSKIVRNIYRKLMKVNGDAFRHFYFYLPIIVNMKTKKIIISDFVNINKLVIRILRRSIR